MNDATAAHWFSLPDNSRRALLIAAGVPAEFVAACADARLSLLPAGVQAQVAAAITAKAQL